MKRVASVSELTRSMLIGSVCGALLLPAFFPLWLATSLDEDLMRCGDGFGSRKKDIDHLLVLMVFAVWLMSVMFGYSSAQIPGAIAASLLVGSIAGAFFAFWVDQRKFA